MPVNVVKSPKEEKIWKRKKKEVSKSKGKPESQFSDQDWGLVNSLFQKAKTKYSGKALPKKYQSSGAFAQAVHARYDVQIEAGLKDKLKQFVTKSITGLTATMLLLHAGKAKAQDQDIQKTLDKIGKEATRTALVMGYDTEVQVKALQSSSQVGLVYTLTDPESKDSVTITVYKAKGDSNYLYKYETDPGADKHLDEGLDLFSHIYYDQLVEHRKVMDKEWCPD